MKSSLSGRVKAYALIGGPLLSLLLLLFCDLQPGHPLVTRTAAVALLMATWWITEAAPLSVTALLPVVLFPMLGIMNGKKVSAIYFNHIIFLFIGGFLVAIAMQRWNLHKRIALRILRSSGTRPTTILFGFMLATAFLSMWISNTATTMMMVPIALAVISHLEEMGGGKRMEKYSAGLFLALAYSASIGGMATLVGTPPNLSFVRIFSISFPKAPEISFAQWSLFALPVSSSMFLLTWGYLSWIYCRGTELGKDEKGVFQEEYRRLGPMSFEEKIVLLDFVVLAFLWIFRSDLRMGRWVIPGWSHIFTHPDFFNDGTGAVAAALMLFLLPSKKRGQERILTSEAVSQLPWGIVVLLGGGFALAAGFKESGLSMWFGHRLEAAGDLHPILLIGFICLTLTFLTELTSNTATAEMLLPIMASLASAVRVNPLLLMVPATLSCSCAFMLPVATPPNAIVFGTKRVQVADMAKTGLLLNLLGVVLITAATYSLGRWVFGIDLAFFPGWASAQ